jgi:cytochrome P450
MYSFWKILHLFPLCAVVSAHRWPYNRYHGVPTKDGHFKPDKSHPEFEHDPQNLLGEWLHNLVKVDSTGQLQQIFVNGLVPHNATFDQILANINIPAPVDKNKTILPPHVPRPWPQQESAELFQHLNYPIDPRCTSDHSRWWYRTYDGSCNWLKADEIDMGQYGTAKSRDFNQHAYADGISEPRKGPNPRAISNAFFKRKQELFYEHTPLMLGLVEFIMHDISYSQDSITEFIEVPMPDDEEHFNKNTTLKVWRTEKAPGTGTSTDKPRENLYMATTWLDVSSLYGSTTEVARALRSFKDGKLLTQDLKTRGAKAKWSYLPFNTMNVPTRTRPGVPVEQLFAGGDPRTNEDWVMMSVHTLFLREHNRLCDILVKQHPEYDDDRVYQTVRLILSAKFSLIGNSYQMAYWTDKMPWPRDDGFPLYRQMYGENVLQINPANTYPWPLVTKGGKPMTVSAEMAVVYRFHEFIIKSFPIKDALNETLWDQDLFSTGFNATGFIDAGLENILRGITSTHIPNFKSGVEETFRTAGKYRGTPFDIVTWSIVHEREQGLPTFNEYFSAYNKQDPMVVVPVRKTFEDFSSDPEAVANLKRLYKSVDEVDLVVGVQLEEQMFPGTTIPKSALIISLFSLFGMGNSDRFSIGFGMMRCLLVDKPWDCHPSNAMEELLWKPDPRPGFPNFRFYDTFWMTELDFQAHGTNLLWRLVTENSEIKCLQQHPLFPMDPETNPVLCSLPKQGVDYGVLIMTGIEIGRALILQRKTEIITLLVTLALILIGRKIIPKKGEPPFMYGYPFLGKALDFQKDPKELLLKGFAEWGGDPSKSFGIKLGSLTNYVLSRPEDLQAMLEDDFYETKYNLSNFFRVINMPIILRKENFDTDLHTKLIRTHLSDPATITSLGKTIESAAAKFLQTQPLVPVGTKSQSYTELTSYLNKYITSVASRCMIGPEAYNHPELTPLFLKFNTDIDLAMGLGTMLPSWLRWVAWFKINADYNEFRKIIKPIIKERRGNPAAAQDGLMDFMPFILDLIEDDDRASDLVVITVWIGLRNLQSTVTSTLLDINNTPYLAPKILSSLSTAVVSNLDTFTPTSASHPSPWALLRSAMFESIRLCGTITGPARIVAAKHPLPLASNPAMHLPPGQIATLSSWYTHRQSFNYANATEYQYDRFVKQDPDIGSTSWITWGLKGPHTCPGRWFTQEAICILVKALLEEYTFDQEKLIESDDEKYIYHAGVVTRKEVGGKVSRR